MQLEKDFIAFLKPLSIDGREELLKLCEEHNIEIDDENIFKPASRLMYLGAKLRKEHRYLYLQLSQKEISDKEIKWITHVDCFNETDDKNVFISVNPSHGTAYCINIV